jgi:hypothetical protein
MSAENSPPEITDFKKWVFFHITRDWPKLKQAPLGASALVLGSLVLSCVLTNFWNVHTVEQKQGVIEQKQAQIERLNFDLAAEKEKPRTVSPPQKDDKPQVISSTYNGETKLKIYFPGFPKTPEQIYQQNIFRWEALVMVEHQMTVEGNTIKKVRGWNIFLTFDQPIDDLASSLVPTSDVATQPWVDVLRINPRSAIVTIEGDYPIGTLELSLKKSPAK